MSSRCCGKSENFLKITWQRLIEEGKTCSRCESTEIEILKAVSILRNVLKPFGIQVLLEKREISPEEFKKDPLSSNQILINGLPIEYWLNAKVGQSPCCDVCAPYECRTIELNGKVFEVPSAELIVRAGIEAVKNSIVIGCC